MTLAVATLIKRTRAKLGDNPFETYTTADPTTSTTVAVTDGTQWAKGDVGEFDDGTSSDQFLVKSISSNDLTVKRSHHGTTAAAHATVPTVVYKNPFFAYFEIKEALERTIDDLWPYVWKSVADTVTPTPTTAEWYDLASDALALIAATQTYGDTVTRVGRFGQGTNGLRPSGLPIEMARQIPTAVATSGVGVRFPGGFFHASNTVNITYAAKVTTTISTTNYSDIDDGLMADMIVHGACARLLSDKDIRRIYDDTSQADASIRPQDRIQTAGWFEQKYRDLRQQMGRELKDTMPLMRPRYY